MKEHRYTPTGRIVMRHIGSERLLVPVNGDLAWNNRVFPVNESGAFIWERLSQGECLGSIAEALSLEFDVGEQDALGDCVAFAVSLEKEGLVARQEADG